MADGQAQPSGVAVSVSKLCRRGRGDRCIGLCISLCSWLGWELGRESGLEMVQLPLDLPLVLRQLLQRALALVEEAREAVAVTLLLVNLQESKGWGL